MRLLLCAFRSFLGFTLGSVLKFLHATTETAHEFRDFLSAEEEENYNQNDQPFFTANAHLDKYYGAKIG
ncbi:MAG: hypothetical protein RL220_1013 [Bacteroidota bacterium]